MLLELELAKNEVSTPTIQYKDAGEVVGRATSDKPSGDVSCWANTGDTFWGISKTFQTIPAGCYSCQLSETGPYVKTVPVVTDNLIILPDEASTEILYEFNKFWESKVEFKKRGFLHKRGILMWGPPGSGKTSTIQLIIQSVINKLNGIILLVNHPHTAVECLKMVRKIEPERPIITILEDIDSLIENFGESGFLSMLDGEAQVDNIVNLATSNYPEKLDARFIDRPSRFDVIKYIGMPSAEARSVYLKAKEPTLTDSELANWVALTEGLTIPHLKETIISVRCYNRSLEQTVERMKGMQKKKFKRENAKTLGFSE